MKYFSLFLMPFLIINCSTSGEETLLKASEIHEQSLEIEEEVVAKFEELEQTKNSINVQARALTDAEIKFVRDVELLGLSLDYWKENHLEVPKADELKKPKKSNIEFSPQDILLIQKEFNDSILAIKIRAEGLKI